MLTGTETVALVSEGKHPRHVPVTDLAGTLGNGVRLLAGDGPPEDAANASLLINPAGDDNAILWTAVDPGTAGNSITVEYVVPDDEDEAVPLSVAVVGSTITITLEVDTDGSTILTTAQDVVDAVTAGTGAWAAVAALVTAALDDDDAENDGTGLLAAAAADALEGGVDGTGLEAAGPGSLYIDYTTPGLYQQTGTAAEPAWTEKADAS